MCEVIGRRKRGNVLEVPCKYIPLCRKATTDQEAESFASKSGHRVLILR